MHKNGVKTIVVMMVLLLVSTAAFAQGNDESSNAQGKTEKVELVLWDVQTSTTLRDIVDAAAQRFMDDHPDVSLDVVHIQNDAYKTKLKVAMGAGTPPDIFHNWGGGVLKTYVDADNVYEITDTVETLKEKGMSASFDPVTFDGKSYGVPYGGLSGVFFWYRQDIFDKYNIEPPKTWDELIEVGEILKSHGIVPLSLANKTKWTGSFYYMYLADRLGDTSMFADAYSGKGSFETPEYVKAGELLTDLVRRDFFPKGFNGMDYDTGQSRTLLYTGKAGMQLMGAWLLGAAKKEAPEEVYSELNVFQFPAIEGGKGDPSNLVGSPGQNYFSISKVTKNKELAEEFLRDYVMDDIWVAEATEQGYISPVKGIANEVEDPILQNVARWFENAEHVQLYYDQYLPPEIGELHKDVVQSLFGLDMTPAEAAEAHQKALDQYMADR